MTTAPAAGYCGTSSLKRGVGAWTTPTTMRGSCMSGEGRAPQQWDVEPALVLKPGPPLTEAHAALIALLAIAQEAAHGR